MIQHSFPYIFILLGILVCGLCFLLCYRMLLNTSKEEQVMQRKNRAEVLTRKINTRLKSDAYRYSKKIKWLSEKGVMYYLKDYKLNLAKYNLLRLVAAGILTLIYAILFPPKLSIMAILLCAGWFLLDLFFLYQNRCDNKAIFKDIYKVYIILSLNLNSNVFIVEAVLKCAENVENKRLKKELMELGQNLSSKVYSVEQALEKFKSRFDNKDITNLVTLLKNYYLFGANDSYIGDLMENLISISNAKALEEQEDIENKGQMYLFLFFALIIAAIAYIMAMSTNFITF